MVIVITMLKLLFAMALGFYLSKKDVLTVEVNKRLSTMIVSIASPLLVISSAGSANGDDSAGVALLLVAGAVLYCVLPLIAFLVAKLVRAPKELMGVYQCMIMLANAGFMGHPVNQALYGNSAIFYGSVFNFGYNVLFYTYATFLIDKDGGSASRFEPRRLVSVGVVAAVIAIILYFTGIKLPAVILEPVSFVGNVSMPLSMMVIGANMASYSLKDIFSEPRVYIMTIIRLLVMPLLTAMYLSFLTDNGLLISVASMTMGMPIGSMLAMASGRYENTARIGNISVAMSTICSMITIPILAVIFRIWFGV